MQFHGKEKYIWQIYIENLTEKDIRDFILCTVLLFCVLMHDSHH